MKTCPGAVASPLGFLARLVTAGVLSGAPVAGMAATAIFTTELPTTDIIRQTTALSSSGNLQVRNLGSDNRWVGVGFAAPDFATTLDRITVYINFSSQTGLGQVNTAALGATMKIELVALDSLEAAPSVPYTPIYSETAVLPLAYNEHPYLTFDLETPFALSAGQNYGIMFSFEDPASGRGINLRTMPGDNAGRKSIGSLFYTTDGGATYTVSSNPLAFVLQTTPSNIPEPSSAALLLGGAGLGAVTLRRRGRSGRL